MNPPAREHHPGLTRDEISAVLPAFKLGEVRSVRALPGGSSQSPKALIECASGRFVIKRREATAAKVAREHAIQALVAARGVPVALPGHGGPSMHAAGSLVYELTRFISGEPARQGPHEAREAGRCLARLHAVPLSALADDRSADKADPIDACFAYLLGRVRSLRVPLESLRHDWHVARDRTAPAPASTGLVHGDYHPANLIWDGPAIAAVLDFEATGAGATADELATAAVLFALETRGLSPVAWADSPDTARLAAFAGGYAEEADPAVLARIDPALQPWRMIEGLITQALPRACRADGFGGHLAADIVPFVAHTSAWIRDHADGLALVLEDELYSGPR